MRGLRRPISLLVVALLSLGMLQIDHPVPAIASDPIIVGRLVIGFGRSVAARNRVYREARDLQREKNQIYDAYRDKLREQLVDRDIASSGRPQAQIYIKLTSIIESERAATTAYIEAEKRQARAEFHRRATRQITTALTNSTMGQNVIGKMRTSLNKMREIAKSARAALEAGDPANVIIGGLQDKFGDTPELRQLATHVGGMVGQELDAALGGILSKLSDLSHEGTATIDGLISEIDRADGKLGTIASTPHNPRSSSGSSAGTDTLTVPGVDSSERTLDVATRAVTIGLARYSVRNGLQAQDQLDPATLATMRDRVRSQLLASKRSVSCIRVSGDKYRGAIAALGAGGAATAAIADPDRFYLICHDVSTKQVILSKPIDEGTDTTTTEPGEEESQPAIPAGTYTGSFDEVLLTDLLSYDSGKPDTNTFSVTVDKEGVISGEIAVHQEGLFLGCSEVDDWRGSIDAGQVIGDELPQVVTATLQISGVESYDASWADAHCRVPPVPFNEQSSLSFSFDRIVDGLLTGEVDDYMPFELRLVP